MNTTFLILFVIIFLIILLEKPRLLADIVNNIVTIRGFITNLLFLIPLITLFFKTDEISTYFTKRTSGIYNNSYNERKKWWEDPKKRTTFKKKQLRKVSESTKKIVASNQQWTCLMCRNILDYSYEIDHNVPLFAGGTNNISNLHALCRNCHGKKTILERNQNFL
tara:strand:+ start:34 stop:528 length:495 start_codon:yes stop_codon:yes gene_type:complete